MIRLTQLAKNESVPAKRNLNELISCHAHSRQTVKGSVDTSSGMSQSMCELITWDPYMTSLLSEFVVREKKKAQLSAN